MKRDTACRIGALFFILSYIIYSIFDPTFSTDPTTQTLLDGILMRFFGCGIFTCTLLYLEYPVFGKLKKRAWMVLFPACLIALNNLPIIPMIGGSVQLLQKNLILLFALECLLIGLFEELAFRGVLLPILLEKYGNTKKRIVWVVILSSLAFGIVHLLNLIQGAGIVGTLMQVGYSFLIGGMCAIVLLKSGNIAWCIFIHALYDFCGALIPTLGTGTIWTTASVIWTAVFSVAVVAWFLYLLFHIKPEENPFYKEKST